MTQAAYTMANAVVGTFLPDLNNHLAAIVSNNSGSSEPGTTFAGMIWADSTADPYLFKVRNADDDAWATLWDSDGAIASAAVPWATPGTIGSGTPNTGAFTTLSTSGLATLNTLEVFGSRPHSSVKAFINNSLYFDSDRSILFNAYFDSTFKYIEDGSAYRVRASNAGYRWYTGPVNASGAGAALTLTQRMILDLSGNLTLDTGDLIATLGDVVVTAGGIEVTAGSVGIGQAPSATRVLEVTSSGTAVFTAYFSRNVSASSVAVVKILQQHETGAQPVLDLLQTDISEGFIDFTGSDRGVVPTSTVDSVASFRVDVNGTTYVVAAHVDQ